jgi:NTE family protein
MANKRHFGLALSGGGFRASLFHLGVLSRLAELDLLRPVEALSTVSGGSIVGALYYLHVQNLLESRKDEEIGPADYQKLVAELTRGFLAAIQRNIRMRAYADPWANLRIALSERYSRSDKLAELYDELLYMPVAQRNPRLRRQMAARPGGRRVRMTDLLVQPAGAAEPFRPVMHNEPRTAKVPMIYLNATSLNTGRHWIFTPTWMGERMGNAHPEADVNAVLRGFYYSDASDKYRALPLSVTVAASAAVPGLFPPMPLTDLYDDWTVELVDGGVHDNLGIGVFAEDGIDFLVSDASDFMPDVQRPSPMPLDVLARTAWVVFDRVRDLTVDGALARHDPVVFLKGGLPIEQIAPRWEREQAPRSGPIETGIDPEVLLLLAAMRTDLDAFSDVEADALMGAGYLITKAQLEQARRPEGMPQATVSPVEVSWDFRWILDELRSPSLELLRELRTARFHLTKTIQLPVRAAMERALAPAREAEAGRAPVRDGKGRFEWMRLVGDLELSLSQGARAVWSRLTATSNRALHAAGELATAALTLPLAVVDLAVTNPIFLAMERRRPRLPEPQPRPTEVQEKERKRIRQVA